MEKRVVAISAGFGLMGLALGAKLFSIQVLSHDRLTRLSLTNYIRAIELPQARGRLLDSEGEVIAGWESGFTLVALSNEEGRFDTAGINRLSELTGVAMQVEEKSYAGYAVLATGLSLAEISAVAEQKEKLPWLLVLGYPARAYPRPLLFSHTTGYVDAQGSGRAGLELVCDSLLSGSPGRQYIVVDANGSLVRTDPLPPAEPVSGADIRLTLKRHWQEVAGEVLAPYERAALVALDVRTGEIKALYSKPGFNLNLMKGGISPAAWDALRAAPGSPLLCRATAGLYPPGSVFKLVTALVGLSLGVVDTSWEVVCPGYLRLGNRTFRCWKSGGHGRVAMKEAIVRSCDVYFYTLGLKIGLERFLEELSRVGFLSEGVTLGLPGERKGFYPSIAWYEKRYGRYGFTIGNTLNLAIGQGEILLTPVQMAAMAGLIAGNGRLPAPHVIKRIGDEYVQTTDTLFLPYEQAQVAFVGKAMELVMTEGTAKYSASDIVPIAGKTGTAQNPHGADHSVFVAYAPADNPAVAVAVVIENGGHGSSAAAPAAVAFLEKVLAPVGK